MGVSFFIKVCDLVVLDEWCFGFLNLMFDVGDLVWVIDLWSVNCLSVGCFVFFFGWFLIVVMFEVMIGIMLLLFVFFVLFIESLLVLFWWWWRCGWRVCFEVDWNLVWYCEDECGWEGFWVFLMILRFLFLFLLLDKMFCVLEEVWILVFCKCFDGGCENFVLWWFWCGWIGLLLFFVCLVFVEEVFDVDVYFDFELDLFYWEFFLCLWLGLVMMFECLVVVWWWWIVVRLLLMYVLKMFLESFKVS